MDSISDIIFYVLAFISVYVQVFLLLTFLENRKKIDRKEGEIKLKKYPGVTIIVPCWNEESTVYKTVRSILNLNYPKNKVQIILVDDGSTDGTWRVISKFAKYQNVKVFKQENGGKYTALNLGLSHTETDFLGCLDADSVADKDSLLRIMQYFEENSSLMAVTPSIVVGQAHNVIEKAQKAEYFMAVYVKKMLSFLGAIHVTPGPLTIFKKKVFDDLGPYRHAHNTEDMEIAYRMQQHYYPIEQCHDAFVYTGTPPSIKKLYKQRVRWIYGFINNTLDYRKILFRKKYGNFSLFTVPAGILATIAAGYIFGKVIYSTSELLSGKILEYRTIGLDITPKWGTFDPFFVNTESIFFISIIIYVLVILSVVLGYKMVKAKGVVSLDVIYFFFIFSMVAPFWIIKALLNTILARKPSWR
ncbi:MAG TPA: glycosyltransferase [Candidatus Paceibacterota bacterium]|nr:glycosyltransferase [Candidatus Paceibacterota bacterium]